MTEQPKPDAAPTTTAPESIAGSIPESTTDTAAGATAKGPEQKPGEIGGPQGPEPTRYGDWEFKGRCSDF